MERAPLKAGHPATAEVLGTRLALIDYAGAVKEVKKRALEQRGPYLVAAANTHMLALACQDAGFRKSIDSFDLVLPDGMPLVWVVNARKRNALADRVYGPDFMLRTLEATQGDAWPHYFLGGDDSLLQALREKLKARFPKLRIAGWHAPSFPAWSAEEEGQIVERIAAASPAFIWVGLGCPKQEAFLSRNKWRLPSGVYAGVGAAFSFHAGKLRQAPKWMQSAGLEWSFRLLMEPGRLWRRYLVYNFLFAYYLARGARSEAQARRVRGSRGPASSREED